ncbi:MAG: methyltransferase [Pseudomonadota bacterium]
MGLYDAWLNLRDRCLTSQRFHRFCEGFVLTQPIVRKRQAQIFDVVSGFVYSQILLCCVELNVFDHVGSGRTVEALSEALGIGLDETRRLCEGAAALRLLQRRGDMFRLGDLGAALCASPGAIAMIKHHPNFYRDLADPAAFLKRGRSETDLSRFWDYAASASPDNPQAQIYSELMATSQAMIARDIIAAYDFSEHQNVLDLGGGHGAFVRALANHYPDLNLAMLDLPAVATQAKALLADAGLASRVAVHAGSFFDGGMPAGADLITLVRIIHDHDDAPAQAILNAAYQALPHGGRLLVCEPMLTGASAERITAAYFNFYLYAMGSGTPRSPHTLEQMLKSAGFASVSRVKTRFPLNTSILQADKSRK